MHTWTILLLVLLGGIFQASAQTDELRMWGEFVRLVRGGDFPVGRIRPYFPGMEETIVSFLRTLREEAREEDWNQVPEVYPVDSLVHYVINMHEEKTVVPYTFSLLRSEGSWFFRHMETIFIRLDRIPPLPASTFPDIAEGKKAWMRQENYWSEMVYFFNYFRGEKGRDAALRFFMDGGGYFVQAYTWVPLVSPARAFILYVCWEQANLQGNPVTLQSVSDSQATVQIDPIYLRLYVQSSHLRTQITKEDYEAIFDTIWQDRARRAGWRLAIEKAGTLCTFHFTRLNRQ